MIYRHISSVCVLYCITIDVFLLMLINLFNWTHWTWYGISMHNILLVNSMIGISFIISMLSEPIDLSYTTVPKNNDDILWWFCTVNVWQLCLFVPVFFSFHCHNQVTLCWHNGRPSGCAMQQWMYNDIVIFVAAAHCHWRRSSWGRHRCKSPAKWIDHRAVIDNVVPVFCNRYLSLRFIVPFLTRSYAIGESNSERQYESSRYKHTKCHRHWRWAIHSWCRSEIIAAQ